MRTNATKFYTADHILSRRLPSILDRTILEETSPYVS